MARCVRSTLKGKGVALVRTIERIQFFLVHLLQCRHGDISASYGRQELSMISSHLGCLVKQGKLFKGVWHPWEWVGFVVLERMVDSWLKTALSQGCLSWDRIILSVLGLVLESSCAACICNIAQLPDYGLETYSEQKKKEKERKKERIQ